MMADFWDELSFEMDDAAEEGSPQRKEMSSDSETGHVRKSSPVPPPFVHHCVFLMCGDLACIWALFGYCSGIQGAEQCPYCTLLRIDQWNGSPTDGSCASQRKWVSGTPIPLSPHRRFVVCLLHCLLRIGDFALESLTLDCLNENVHSSVPKKLRPVRTAISSRSAVFEKFLLSDTLQCKKETLKKFIKRELKERIKMNQPWEHLYQAEVMKGIQSGEVTKRKTDSAKKQGRGRGRGRGRPPTQDKTSTLITPFSRAPLPTLVWIANRLLVDKIKQEKSGGEAEQDRLDEMTNRAARKEAKQKNLIIPKEVPLFQIRWVLFWFWYQQEKSLESVENGGSSNSSGSLLLGHDRGEEEVDDENEEEEDDCDGEDCFEITDKEKDKHNTKSICELKAKFRDLKLFLKFYVGTDGELKMGRYSGSEMKKIFENAAVIFSSNPHIGKERGGFSPKLLWEEFYKLFVMLTVNPEQHRTRKEVAKEFTDKFVAWKDKFLGFTGGYLKCEWRIYFHILEKHGGDLYMKFGNLKPWGNEAGEHLHALDRTFFFQRKRYGLDGLSREVLTSAYRLRLSHFLSGTYSRSQYPQQNEESTEGSEDTSNVDFSCDNCFESDVHDRCSDCNDELCEECFNQHTCPFNPLNFEDPSSLRNL